MTLQQIGITLIGALLIILGLSLNALAFMSIYSLETAIFYANLAILHEETITTFMRPIAGLLSGGYLKIVDTKYLYLMVISGWVLLWLGAQFIIFTKNKIALKFILSKKYWSVIDWELMHKRKYRESDLPWSKVKNAKKNTK